MMLRLFFAVRGGVCVLSGHAFLRLCVLSYKVVLYVRSLGLVILDIIK